MCGDEGSVGDDNNARDVDGENAKRDSVMKRYWTLTALLDAHAQNWQLKFGAIEIKELWVSLRLA